MRGCSSSITSSALTSVRSFVHAGIYWCPVECLLEVAALKPQTTAMDAVIKKIIVTTMVMLFSIAQALSMALYRKIEATAATTQSAIQTGVVNIIIDLKCYSPKASLFTFDTGSNDLYHKMQEAGWQTFKETGANSCEVVVD